MIQPEGMTATEWCNYMTDTLNQFGQAPIIREDSQWRDWALCVLNFQEIAVCNPPNPWDGEDWVQWANNFNLVVRI